MIFSNLQNIIFNKDSVPIISDELNIFLKKIKYDDYNKKLRRIITDYYGNPYKINPLSIEKDNFPSFSLYYQDCTLFVINSLSLSVSENYSEYIENYIDNFYYSKNKISYVSRIHFTEDRLLSNPNFSLYYPDILKPLEQKIICVLNKKSNGNKLLDIDFSKKIEIKILSSENLNMLNDFFKKNKGISGIAFVRKKNIENGHLISHEGFIFDSTLYHASKDTGSVCQTNDIPDYIKRCNFDGIIFFKYGFY
ncbi:DUF1460 domain-containing protein [Candidatus Dependentiae bacterium]|nr:DUF1460 domain-containing protein [Candidatus Dependentiae bacterium]